MARAPPNQRTEHEQQLVYEEYELGSGRLATIFHRENDAAWIQSDVTMAIRD